LAEVRLDYLVEWYDERSRGLIEPTKEKARKIVDKVREILQSLGQIFNSLISNAEGEDARDYASRFVEKISSSTSKVSIPNEISYKSLQDMSISLGRSISSMYEAARLYGQKMKSLKAEIGNLDSQLRKLVNEARGLEDLLSTEYEEARHIEDTRERLEKFKSEAEELLHLSDSIEAFEKSKREVEAELKELKAVGGEEGSEQLKMVEHRLEGFKIRLLSLFSPLEKSMRKMDKLVRDGACPIEIEQKMLLEGFLASPFQAFISTKDDQEIIALLSRVKALIEGGRLGLNRSKEVRALEVLQTITVKSLEELRREYEDLQRKEDETKRLITVDERHSRLEDLKKRAEELANKISGQKMRYNRLKEEEVKRRRLIEEALSRILNEEVRILTN